jgi:hypothetical protein
MSQKDLVADLHFKIDALRRCPLFRALDDAALKRLSLQFRTREFGAQQSVFAAGDAIRDVYLIVDGQCAITRTHYPPPLPPPQLNHGATLHADAMAQQQQQLPQQPQQPRQVPLAACFAGQFLGVEPQLFESDKSQLSIGAQLSHDSLHAFQSQKIMQVGSFCTLIDFYNITFGLCACLALTLPGTMLNDCLRCMFLVGHWHRSVSRRRLVCDRWRRGQKDKAPDRQSRPQSDRRARNRTAKQRQTETRRSKGSGAQTAHWKIQRRRRR